MFVILFISRSLHPNSDIRINAVTKLNPSKSSDAEKLWQLAFNDSDEDVRIAAIMRIEESSQLFELLTTTHDAKIIHALATRIDQLFESQKLTLNELQQLNATVITELLCTSTNATIHNQLVPAIQQQEQLAQLAMFATLAATRQVAAKQLNDEPLILKVHSYAKEHDKAVYRIIRDQQKLKQQALLEQQAAECQCNEMILQLSDLVNSPYDRHTTARLEHLSQQWLTLSRSATEQQTSRFNLLKNQLQQQLDAIKNQAIVDAEMKAQQQALNTQIEALEESIERQVCHFASTTDADLQQLVLQLHILLEQPLDSEQRHQCKRLKQLLECFLKIHEQADRFTSLSEQVSTAISIDDLDACLTQANSLCHVFQDWPKESISHPQLSLLNQHIHKLQQKRKQLEQDLRATAEREHQHQQQILEEKEHLCIAMEALIDLELPANEKAQHIRALQQQWKELDQKVTVSVKSLWDRFHRASKQAYAPCEQYFREQSRLRAWNLSQREEICQLLETYYEALDWTNPDWSSMEQILKKAKAEWREFSPVDRAPGKPLQERFNALIKRADTALNRYRQACANAKQSIVEEASTLAAADESEFATATQRFKELQAEWKLIGAAEHKRERQLWKAFREQGDLLFSRLRAHQQHQRSQEELSARLLCVRLEILLNQSSPESDQYLRMEYQMERLEEALETPSAEEQSIELANLVNQWHQERYADQYPELDERFQQLLDHDE